MQIRGQSQPIAELAICRQAKSEPLKIVFQVPINVWLPAGVKLTFNDTKLEIVASYNRCLPVGCFADTGIDENKIKELRALKENGKLQFKDAAKQEITIPLSLKGLGAAYDTMQKL